MVTNNRQKFSEKDERLAEFFRDVNCYNEGSDGNECIESNEPDKNMSEIDLIEKTFGNYVFKGANLDKPPGLTNYNNLNNVTDFNSINQVNNDDDIARWRNFDYEFGMNNNNSVPVTQNGLLFPTPSPIIPHRASSIIRPQTPVVPRHQHRRSENFSDLDDTFTDQNITYYPPLPKTYQYMRSLHPTSYLSLDRPHYKKTIPKIREVRLLENCTMENFKECEKSYNIPKSIIAQFLIGYFKKNIVEKNSEKRQQKENYENFKKILVNQFKEYICLYSSSSEYQKQIIYVLLEYLQTFQYSENNNYKESALSTFKDFTVKKENKPRKINIYYNNQEISKLCCVMGEEMNDILIYLIENFKIDLRIDNDIMLDLCTSTNNVTGFKLIFDTILSYGQQIDHKLLSDLLLHCTSFGYFEIVKIILSYDLFLNYTHLYLRRLIKNSIENHKYDIFNYLCIYLIANVTDVEIQKKILNRAFVAACSLNDRKAFKFLINLPRNVSTFEINMELIINCIQVGSNKIASLLINKILKNLHRKEILPICEKILIACICYNQTKLMIRVEKILMTYNKNFRWNKIIKQLFSCKFLETVNIKNLKLVLKIMKFYNFKKIHDFDSYIDSCLTSNNVTPEIFQKFLKFTKKNDVPIKINLNNLGSYFEKAFRSCNVSNLYFLCSYIYVYHSENNTDFQPINHFVTPQEFNNMFDILLEENDLLYAIVEVLGKNFFVKNELFKEKLLKSIDILDNKHMTIAETCVINNIDLFLEDKNYKLFRVVCATRDKNRIEACLEVHSYCKKEIDFSNAKVKIVMSELAYRDPFLLYRIKESTIYRIYLDKNKKLDKTKNSENLQKPHEIMQMNKNLSDVNRHFTNGTVLTPKTYLNNTRIITLDSDGSDDSDSSYDTDDSDYYTNCDAESTTSNNSNLDEYEDENKDGYETIQLEPIPSHVEPPPGLIKLTLDNYIDSNNNNDNDNDNEPQNELLQHYSSLRQSFDDHFKNLEINSLPFHNSLPLPIDNMPLLINNPPLHNPPPPYNLENEVISGSPLQEPSPLYSSLSSVEKKKYEIYDYDPSSHVSYVEYNSY